jgi:hypothetical protein
MGMRKHKPEQIVALRENAVGRGMKESPTTNIFNWTQKGDWV